MEEEGGGEGLENKSKGIMKICICYPHTKCPDPFKQFSIPHSVLKVVT